ncbi:MAG: hypothetical protein FGM57_00910 [Candidatus Taylorbacteria bacterium]|nr:hypothetical protein [Candidatus Taylorbacteria bacterium]
MTEIKSNHSEDKSNFQSIITGIWKFKQEIPTETLEQVANEWKSDPKYIQIYIRKVSKDQYGIGFMYDDRDTADNEASYNEFFDRMTDQLKKKFGNGLCGWDVSSSTVLIK